MSPTLAPAHRLESISCVRHGSGNKAEPRDILKMELRVSPGSPRQLEFTRQDTVEERAAERKCWRSVGSFSQVFHQIHMSPCAEENYCRQREEPFKRIRGKSAWSLHRATIVPVPTSQTQKTLQFPGRLFRRLLPQ